MLTVEEKKVLFEAAGRAFGAMARAAGLLREACLAVARGEAGGGEIASQGPVAGAVVAGRRELK